MGPVLHAGLEVQPLNFLSFPLLLVAGLMAPGWLLGRALSCPAGPLGAFLGSSVLLLNTLLVLDAVAGQFNVQTVSLALAGVCIILLVVAKWREPHSTTVPNPTSPHTATARFKWFCLPAAIGLLAILAKAGLDPLSGFDTKFRWDLLARQMLEQGSLSFYPPVSSADFLHYPWCDGIAPLISSSYFWAYLSFGSASSHVTAPIVMGQAYLLFVSVYKLACSRGGPAAGFAAIGVLATSVVFLLGVAMGQETGMTALSVVAMFLFIEKHREQGNISWLVWGGIAAGAGGLAREYGLVFSALGVLALVNHRASHRDYITFLVTASAIMLPWYARNWIRTGHPLFNHPMGGLFPTNAIHLDYMRAVSDLLSITRNLGSNLAIIITLLGTLTGIPLCLGMFGVLSRGRTLWAWASAFLAVLALWLWSVHQTSGGYQYSLRVLTPALALAAVFGGLFLARFQHVRFGWLFVAFLTVFSIDTAQKVLFAPFSPAIPWYTAKSEAWGILTHRERFERFERDGNWRAVIDAADGRMILVNDPYTWARLRERGAEVMPLFSPLVRFLFEPEVDLKAFLARLRANGFRFIILSDPDQVSNLQLSRSTFFRLLMMHQPTAVVPFGAVYDLYAGEYTGSAQ